MATLQDVARAVGLDRSTVSRALRSTSRDRQISAETRRRVQEMARRLNYQPNLIARQLRTSQSKTLALFLNYLSDPWAAAVMEGFEGRAAELGYRVMILGLHDQQDPLELHREVLSTYGITAMACIGSSRARLSDQALQSLADDNVKLMLAGRTVDHPRIGWVMGDNYGGAMQAALHLYQQGLRELWIIAGMTGCAMEARIQGFTDAGKSVGAAPARIIEAKTTSRHWLESARETVANQLEQSVRPEGVLTLADPIAIGAMHAFSAAGLQVGRDVAVVGYDDGILASTAWPPLTTVRQPIADLGRATAEGLISMLDQPDALPPRIVQPAELIVRGSSQIRPLSAAASNHRAITMNPETRT
jgi:LacI family transcriptional regulator